ncbi:hypothetical protein PFISCL1PPCAC_14484, partial [Pristionchus fissidentatus]
SPLLLPMKTLVIVALATVACAALPPFFGGRRQGGFTSHLHQNVEIDPALLASDTIGSDTFDQKLDHFDDKSTKTWKQKYFFNYQYKKDDSNVNFLYLSGEQVASVGMIMAGSSYAYYASTFNAALYALEHRFYGASHPTEDTSVENLNKYLSSRQAIEDIAEFIRQKNAEKGGNQKWIVVGGSYAGAMSSWIRLKHPELVAGSLASSGPVLAQLDFFGYLQTVDEDFKKVGGLCYDQISLGLEKARKLMQSAEGRDQLTTEFRIVPALSSFDDLSANDIDTFYSYLINNFEGAAQYSSPSISAVCEKFTAGGASADPLKAFKPIVSPIFEVNFTASVDSLRGTAFKGDISSRLWIYQTCAEFGYFQSSNRGTNVFGQTQSTSPFIELCIQLFGIDADQIEKNIESVNAYYGERDYYAGTNVVFSHGTQDPWSFLSKKDDSRHSSVVLLEIEGGDHCSDLGVSCFTSPHSCTDNMKQVQQITLENMQRWINPVEDVPDHIDIVDNVGKRPLDAIPGPATAVASTEKLVKTEKIRGRRIGGVRKASKKHIDLARWNKFTGKGKRMHVPPPANDVQFDATLGQDFIVQTWDHFNASEKRTFKQKWYYNTKMGSKDGPNFLMIGGEGPESIYWISSPSMAWSTYAKEVGANLFDLEHRYYGESKLGTNDLQYLTSSQMLYDVATFIRTRQEVDGLTGPWITFGGSYPGALAAWSREWFPELILGAVGSSGPVLAKNDFYEYLEVVEDVVKRQGGACYQRTSAAFNKLHKLSQDPAGRKIISDKFKLWPAWTGAADEVIDTLDLNEVFSGLYGVYQGTVQYNSVDWSDVRNMCAPMEDELRYPDPVDALRAVQVLVYGDPSAETLSSYDYDMDYLIQMKNYVDGKDTTGEYSDDDLASLLWTWQTCNEFGYYQTTDYGEGIFGTPVPVNFFVIMCERVFGVGMDDVEASIKNTNYQYGGRHKYSATNVVLPNGDADPWHALGIIEQENQDKSVVPVLISGTSHCADMYGQTSKDPQSLIDARKTVLTNIKQWLSAPPVSNEPAYCGCKLGGSGSKQAVGWNPSEIWVDVVVVLDTSVAMGSDSLAAASSMVESFVGDGVLSTDLSATFSTRVGVISMGSDAKVLYDLNMKKGDKISAQVDVGLSSIDVSKAFTAASDMLSRGAKSRPERANFRQVIYYATDSDATSNLNAAKTFKNSAGIVVVNNFLKKGESAKNGLQQLASDGYFLKDARDNYMTSIQSFCKANCRCAADRVAYAGRVTVPGVNAAGGCYNAVATGVTFSKAQQSCASNRGGLIASVHDAEKNAFLNDQVLAVYNKPYFFWIGYSKNDSGKWVWEDNSTDAYTNWDVSEPSSASISKCANVDMSEDNLPWAAGNCNIGFPYVCEYAPCSAGNKNC